MFDRFSQVRLSSCQTKHCVPKNKSNWIIVFTRFIGCNISNVHTMCYIVLRHSNRTSWKILVSLIGIVRRDRYCIRLDLSLVGTRNCLATIPTTDRARDGGTVSWPVRLWQREMHSPSDECSKKTQSTGIDKSALAQMLPCCDRCPGFSCFCSSSCCFCNCFFFRSCSTPRTKLNQFIRWSWSKLHLSMTGILLSARTARAFVSHFLRVPSSSWLILTN